ncbi:E4 SUMO-protein ligase PIAL2-like isoform X2 [Lotus japonicus]|nr:E4 SUMO-protein ligase PIAL2-like isoform X2 [Lotus japonicus]
MENVNDGPSSCHSTISKIMERFYPTMNLEPILVSIEAKPGYGASAVDFHITKSSFVPDKRICLLVAQTDNIETSACLINPPEVTFLLNGIGVFKRTCVPMETGPQMPTNVTSMLKFGTNLLQAVGQFNGHYLIVVAYLSGKSLPKHLILQDYVQPAVTSVYSDVTERESRISLNCPISLTRIKTPVKGHSCKHFQCFDFHNFIHINSKKPSWRCPSCNQYVCYADIRLDRNMVEILKNVGENIVDVTVLADGSWTAVLENDYHVAKIKDKAPNCEKEQAELQESTCSPSTVANVLDLTCYDDHLDMMETCETEDRKPFQESVASQNVTPSLTYSGMNSTAVHENVAAHIEDDFGSRDYIARAPVGVSEHPVLPDTMSPVSNLEAEGHGIIQAINSAPHNQFTSPYNFQMQSNINSVANEYGRSSSIPRHISRIPVAIQGLPVQSQLSGPQQNSVTNLNSLLLSGSSSPHVSLTNPASIDVNILMNDMDVRQLLTQYPLTMAQVSGVNSSALQNHSTIQNRGPSVVNMSARTQSQNPLRPTQNRGPSVVNMSARTQSQNPLRPSGFFSELGNPHLQQALNPRPLQPMQSWPWMQQGGSQTGVAQAAAATANIQQARVVASGRQGSSQAGIVQTAGTNSSLQQARFMAAAHASRQSQSSTAQYQSPAAAVQSVSRPEDLFSSQPDQNWRPTRRMRGSIDLGSQQYSEAVRQQIIMPTQPVQSSRPQGPPLVPVQSSRPQGPLPVPVQSSRPQVLPPPLRPTSK